MVFTLFRKLVRIKPKTFRIANTRRNSLSRRDFLPNKESPTIDKMVPYKNNESFRGRLCLLLYNCSLSIRFYNSLCVLFCQFNPGRQQEGTKGRLFRVLDNFVQEAQMHVYIEPLNGYIDVTSFFRRMQFTTQKIAFLF